MGDSPQSSSSGWTEHRCRRQRSTRRRRLPRSRGRADLGASRPTSARPPRDLIDRARSRCCRRCCSNAVSERGGRQSLPAVRRTAARMDTAAAALGYRHPPWLGAVPHAAARLAAEVPPHERACRAHVSRRSGSARVPLGRRSGRRSRAAQAVAQPTLAVPRTLSCTHSPNAAAGASRNKSGCLWILRLSPTQSRGEAHNDFATTWGQSDPPPSHASQGLALSQCLSRARCALPAAGSGSARAPNKGSPARRSRAGGAESLAGLHASRRPRILSFAPYARMLKWKRGEAPSPERAQDPRGAAPDERERKRHDQGRARVERAYEFLRRKSCSDASFLVPGMDGPHAPCSEGPPQPPSRT